MQGQEIIDSIKLSIKNGSQQAENSYAKEEISPFKHIARRLQMKKGALSKSEILASYMAEVKKDLIKNLEMEFPEDISMTSVTEEEGDEEAMYMAGEAQSAHSTGDVDIAAVEEYLQQFQDQLEGSPSKTKQAKGKGHAP